MPWKGDSQPPKNSSVVSMAIRTMLAYSARKKIAKAMPEYSTWKPATISDSPSATSKGAVGLGDAGDVVDPEQRQQRQPEPGQEAAGLGLDDGAQVQAAGGHQHADQANPIAIS
jgi:hypothetical protein